MPVIVDCHQCGGPAKKMPYEVAQSTTGRHFCSYGCHRAYQNKRVRVECPICSTPRDVKAYRLAKRPIIYCSSRCRAIGLGGGSQLVYCGHCGDEFRRRNAEVKEVNFCSTRCMGRWQSQHVRGAAHPSWRGGYKYYYGADWISRRREARERDGHTCQGCGLKQANADHTLEVHHLKPVRLFPKANDANSPDNLILLCRTCHVKADVYARWLFNLGGSQSLGFHPLHNDTCIARVYLKTITDSTLSMGADHCGSGA